MGSSGCTCLYRSGSIWLYCSYMRRQSTARPTVTWDTRQETISLSSDTLTVVSQLQLPCKLQKYREKKDRGPVMPSLPKKERLWLLRHQRSPKIWCVYDSPSQMGHQGMQPQNKWEGSHSLRREHCVVLASLKTIRGNYYCQIWRDSGFQSKPNHC